MGDDVPTLVFSGTYEEVLFLKTLLESAGIEASLDGLPHRRIIVESRLFVRRADAEHASELVADFRKNGRRSNFSNL
jgi:hypothetical protein